jgi:glycosyltransferase involved in cell wall biosynthesis
MSNSVSVIIPTKNEIDAIKQILPQVNLDWADEWIVIDGNSTDGTVEEAEKLGFKAIRQKGDGLGDAYREAVKAASCENILFFSPDGNAPPEYIPKLIKKMNEGNYDIVQISRFGKNGKSEDDTPLTAFGNRMFTFLANCFFGGKLTDTLFGFKIIKKKVFQEINLDAEFLTLEQQMSIKSMKLHLKIAEIDGTEPKRVAGEAKMRPFVTGRHLSLQIIKEFIFWKN